MANAERLQKVLEFVSDDYGDPTEHFNMASWVRMPDHFASYMSDCVYKILQIKSLECGTTFCVAGAAVYLYPVQAREIMDSGIGNNIVFVAQELLDLNTNEAEVLFHLSEEDAIDKMKTLIRDAKVSES